MLDAIDSLGDFAVVKTNPIISFLNPELFIAGGEPLPLQILHYPHPTLRHKSKPLKKVDAELRRMVAEMFDLMYEHDGVGLAANQVDLPYRLFVANPEGDRQKKDLEYVFLNPVIMGGRGQVEGDEGCLSIPDVRGDVIRKETIKVQAYDLQGSQVNAELNGLFSRIFQHETDHLDGVLFIDRLAPAQFVEVKGKLEEFELDFRSKRETGELPSDEQVMAHLAELEQLRT